MNYQETVDYLFTRLPMFSRVGAAAYKADLDNTLELCRFLGNPEKTLKTIHIAGTNGKGSVSHMLVSILQQAGFKTGLYTSPHLKDFRERVKIDGEFISTSFVVDFTRRIQPLIDKIEPSFFEITVAMAFSYFADQQVDIAVIETGLGGRLDSTNVITPEVSVITNIGWDHMNLLGDTLPKIAGEKAGIIKTGVPVVIGETLPDTLPVFEKTAILRNAPLHIASQSYEAMEWHWEKHQLAISVARQGKTDHKNYLLDLPGIYQTKNLLTVLQTCELLQEQGWSITDDDIHKGLAQVRKTTGLHGRWEIIHQHPLVVLDVAHNEAGMRQLVEQVEVTPHRHLHIILGMVNDKAIDKVLRQLPSTAHYYFSQASIPRALEASLLAQQAEIFGLRGQVAPDVNDALQLAVGQASQEDLIIVCGSIFLIGELRS